MLIVAPDRLSFSSNANSSIPIDRNSNEKIDFRDKVPSNRYEFHDEGLFDSTKENVKSRLKSNHSSNPIQSKNTNSSCYVRESDDVVFNSPPNNQNFNLKRSNDGKYNGILNYL